MGRAPCCDKVGLKKGAWSAEEDKILVDYIQQHGHGNWRVMPKKAGFDRVSYAVFCFAVRRWSAIAGSLPGRTDNEIKNVWHTHLKKRMDPKEATRAPKREKKKKRKRDAKNKLEAEQANQQPDADAAHRSQRCDDAGFVEVSLEQSYSGFSSAATDSSVMSGDATVDAKDESFTSKEFKEIDESFWLDALAVDGPLQLPPAAVADSEAFSDDMEFWLKVFMEADHLEDSSQMNPANVHLN
ncbi:hypothetical protein GW17_00054243 [Ensete ventricosum]|nr:hypothetical protein GW17_00054243 [Ensete ventricosum]